MNENICDFTCICARKPISTLNHSMPRMEYVQVFGIKIQQRKYLTACGMKMSGKQNAGEFLCSKF